MRLSVSKLVETVGRAIVVVKRKSECGEMNSTSRCKLLLPTLGAGV